MNIMNRRELLAIAATVLIVRPVEIGAAPTNTPIVWDFEIQGSWTENDGNVRVSGFQRGSENDPAWEGFGNWRFAWPSVSELGRLGPRDLCEELMISEWFDDAEVGTVTIEAGLI